MLADPALSDIDGLRLTRHVVKVTAEPADQLTSGLRLDQESLEDWQSTGTEVPIFPFVQLQNTIPTRQINLVI